MSDITTLRFQKVNKPKIEDVLPHYLEGKMLESALNFIAYLCAKKMNPVWSTHNRWKYAYKGKMLLNIELGKLNQYHKKTKWQIHPYLKHIDVYEDLIFNEGLQDFVWNNLMYCGNVFTGKCNSHGCAPGMNRTILGREITKICRAHASTGRNIMCAFDPDEATIECIKKLLEFEKNARKSDLV